MIGYESQSIAAFALSRSLCVLLSNLYTQKKRKKKGKKKKKKKKKRKKKRRKKSERLGSMTQARVMLVAVESVIVQRALTRTFLLTVSFAPGSRHLFNVNIQQPRPQETLSKQLHILSFPSTYSTFTYFRFYATRLRNAPADVKVATH